MCVLVCAHALPIVHDTGKGHVFCFHVGGREKGTFCYSLLAAGIAMDGFPWLPMDECPLLTTDLSLPRSPFSEAGHCGVGCTRTSSHCLPRLTRSHLSLRRGTIIVGGACECRSEHYQLCFWTCHFQQPTPSAVSSLFLKIPFISPFDIGNPRPQSTDSSWCMCTANVKATT
jgi:hypothetical protein